MSTLIKRSSIDMTEGPLLRKMLLFMLPMMATNLLQIFYNSADVMIAGLSSNQNAIGAVGSSGVFLALITNIFIGFSVGADVVVARNIGAKDKDRISKSVHTAIFMSVIFGVLGSFVGITLARPLLVAMKYTGDLLELSLIYCTIYLLALPFISLTNFLAAIFRSKGDTKTPLYVLSATGLLNVLLNLLFVLGLNMTVEGVAIATAVSNIVSAAVMFILLTKENGDCRIYLKKIRPSKSEFFDIFHIGFPSGIQNSFFSISNMLIQSSIIRVDAMVAPGVNAYSPVVKGDSSAANIENLAFAFMNAVSQSAGTFTGQNVGVGNYRRVKKVLGTASFLAVVFAISASALIIICNEPLLSLYGVKKGADFLAKTAYEASMTRLWFRCAPFFLIALMNTTAGVLRGLGKSITAAVIAFVGTCVFRVVWVLTVFEHFQTLESIYISYPISWALNVLALLFFILTTLRKKIKEQDLKTA